MTKKKLEITKNKQDSSDDNLLYETLNRIVKEGYDKILLPSYLI